MGKIAATFADTNFNIAGGVTVSTSSKIYTVALTNCLVNGVQITTRRKRPKYLTISLGASEKKRLAVAFGVESEICVHMISPYSSLI